MAEKYYLMSVENNNVSSIYNLAYIYEIQNKYDLAEKYYLMAIENHNVPAIINLANTYETQEKYDLAEKYYLMDIENHNVVAMNNLAFMYKKQKKYDLAEKYYLMAIENHNIAAMKNLACMYQTQKKYDLAEKYYLMAIDNCNQISMFNLANMYEKLKNYSKMIIYYAMACYYGYQKSINYVNTFLNKDFNLEFAIKCADHLNEDNLNNLNKLIIYIVKKYKQIDDSNLESPQHDSNLEPFLNGIKISTKDISVYANNNTDFTFDMRFCESFVCTFCQQEQRATVFLLCGHSIYIDCFDGNNKCKLCK